MFSKECWFFDKSFREAAAPEYYPNVPDLEKV